MTACSLLLLRNNLCEVLLRFNILFCQLLYQSFIISFHESNQSGFYRLIFLFLNSNIYDVYYPNILYRSKTIKRIYLAIIKTITAW